MDQQQRDRLDEDDISDTGTDVTRSENRQRTSEANTTNVEAGTGAGDTRSKRAQDSTRDDAFSSGTTSDVIGGREDAATGSHAEGMYPKQGQGGTEGQVGKPGDKPE